MLYLLETKKIDEEFKDCAFKVASKDESHGLVYAVADVTLVIVHEVG